MYTYPMGAIIRRYNINYHLYADDVQLYIEFDPKIPGDAAVAAFKLQACIAELKTWMSTNKLQLNESKTEFMVLASKHNLKDLSTVTLNLDNTTIIPSTVIKNLGVKFESDMSMTAQVASISSSTNYHLRNINRIRRFIDKDTCEQAVRALITSRLDYCNSLLINITAKDIQKLQKIQNRSGRLIFRASRRENTSPLIQELHWLPVKQRIIFKTLLLAYKCLHNQAPIYLTELLHIYIPSVNLRSGHDQPRLVVNRTFTTQGDRAFTHTAPMLWNTLPNVIRNSITVASFKSQTKTHLFPD
ncbi:uncharacterized protein [Amphiura filiformis]|uniref:uncharacterized protein n=1 Tax=Amphiura filiformis TaxID=82378 RepID=UPI003B21B2D3